MLFGEGAATGPTCCSPSAPTTCARTPARSPSPAARSTRARPRVEAALREAEEETGLDPTASRSSAELPAAVAAAEQLRGHAGARLVARAEPGRTWSTRARCTRSTGCRSASCSTPAHRITVTHPGRAGAPRLPDRRRQGRHPVGLHRRDHRPAVRLPRLDRGRGTTPRCATCPPTCWPAGGSARTLRAQHRLRASERRDEPARLAAASCSCSPTRSPATGRASSPAPSPPPACCSAASSASGSRRSRSATPTRRCWCRSARCSS